MAHGLGVAMVRQQRLSHLLSVTCYGGSAGINHLVMAVPAENCCMLLLYDCQHVGNEEAHDPLLSLSAVLELLKHASHYQAGATDT